MGKSTALRVLASALLCFSAYALSVVDLHEFDSQDQRQRYYTLSEELRCPKCQNQNLAGSDSSIAGDLRRELHRLLLEGKTDREIKTFMVDRYGDFVLYKPRLQRSTFLLWGLPVLLLIMGLLGLVLVSRHKAARQNSQANTPEPLSDNERSELDHLLDNTDNKE